MSEEGKERILIQEPSSLKLLLNVASLGAGAYNGFCDAKNIPQPANLEFALTYGPTIVRGTLGAVVGGLVGLVGGGVAGGAAGCEASNSNPLGALAGAGIGAAAGTVFAGAVGGVFGAVAGAFYTTVGYGLGYVTGKLV